MRRVPLTVSLPTPLRAVHPLTAAVAQRPAVSCSTPFSLTVTGLESKNRVPVLRVARMPGRSSPLTVMAALVIGLFALLLPERVAPSATVSLPVPRHDDVPMSSSPSLTVVVPVLSFLPFQVTLPSPTLTKLALEVTRVDVLQFSSLPTCQVLAPTLLPLLKVQLPPSAPVPVTRPMRKVLPLFCTSTVSAMFIVPLGMPVDVLSVKRRQLGSSTLDEGLSVPSKSEKLHCTGVRVA